MEIKPIKGDLSDALKHVIRVQEEYLNKLLENNPLGVPEKYFGKGLCSITKDLSPGEKERLEKILRDEK